MDFMDRTVKLCDATTGTRRQTLEGHSSDVTSVAFSNDSEYNLSELYAFNNRASAKERLGATRTELTRRWQWRSTARSRSQARVDGRHMAFRLMRTYAALSRTARHMILLHRLSYSSPGNECNSISVAPGVATLYSIVTSSAVCTYSTSSPNPM
jgi:WD40 repeat protein